MPVLTSLVMNDVEYILENVPEGLDVRIRKEWVNDTEAYYDVTINDDDLCAQFERKIQNLYTDEDEFNFNEIYEENDDYK